MGIVDGRDGGNLDECLKDPEMSLGFWGQQPMGWKRLCLTEYPQNPLDLMLKTSRNQQIFAVWKPAPPMKRIMTWAIPIPGQITTEHPWFLAKAETPGIRPIHDVWAFQCWLASTSCMCSVFLCFHWVDKLRLHWRKHLFIRNGITVFRW